MKKSYKTHGPRGHDGTQPRSPDPCDPCFRTPFKYLITITSHMRSWIKSHHLVISLLQRVQETKQNPVE